MSFPPTIYMVVTAADRFDLEDDVKNKIADGWQPQGGISISFRDAKEPFIIYAQAMIQVQHDLQKV